MVTSRACLGLARHFVARVEAARATTAPETRSQRRDICRISSRFEGPADFPCKFDVFSARFEVLAVSP